MYPFYHNLSLKRQQNHMKCSQRLYLILRKELFTYEFVVCEKHIKNLQMSGLISLFDV